MHCLKRIVYIYTYHSWMPYCFQEIHTCQLLVPFSACSAASLPSFLREDGKSSLHLCLGKRGRGLLCASVAFQNEDSSTRGPKELTFLYTELFSYPTWDMLRGKNILGILSIPLSLFRSERPSIPLYGSPGAFSCHPRFIFLAQSSSLHSRLLSR